MAKEITIEDIKDWTKQLADANIAPRKYIYPFACGKEQYKLFHELIEKEAKMLNLSLKSK